MPPRYIFIFIENAKICLNFSFFLFFLNSLCYTIFLLNWNWVALIGYGRTTTATILVIQFSNIHYSSTHKKGIGLFDRICETYHGIGIYRWIYK